MNNISRNLNKKPTALKNVGIFSLSFAVAASALYLYSPVIKTHAEESASADVNLNVAETMSFRLDKEVVSLKMDPNTFASGSLNAIASTNSQYGYTISVEDVDDSSDLVHVNSEIKTAIKSDFLGPKTASEMADNTWGFSLNNTDYYGMPINGNPVAIKRTNTQMTADEESTNISFGTKAGNLISGKYSDKVLFTMYVNGQDGKPSGVDPVDPGVDPNSDPTTMQGFKCSSLANEGDTASLRDVRDDKVYSVKKLADGNCWMTQNLAIGGNEPITLNSSNSDVSDNFTLPASATSSGSLGYDKDTAALFVHSRESYGAIYNWYTAVAGSATETSLTSGAASASICPKGWRLPNGGYSDSSELSVLSRSYPNSEGVLFIDAFVSSGSSDYNKWWTSAADTGGYAFYNYYYRSILATNSSRTNYYSVRCVAR